MELVFAAATLQLAFGSGQVALEFAGGPSIELVAPSIELEAPSTPEIVFEGAASIEILQPALQIEFARVGPQGPPGPLQIHHGGGAPAATTFAQLWFDTETLGDPTRAIPYLIPPA